MRSRLLFLGAGILTFLCAPGEAIINPPAPPDTTSPACQVLAGASNLKYFGFFASSIPWFPIQSSHDEIKDFINVNWIAGSDLNFLTQELNKARNANQKAIVGNLATDPAVWANTIVPLLQPYYNSGTLLGFYMADDVWRDPEAVVRQQIQRIKASFPETVTIAIFIAPNTIDFIPPELDWIGLETYQWANPHSEPPLGGTSYWQSWLDSVATRMTPNQKFILVPGSFTQGTCEPTRCAFEDPAFVESILRVATNNPRVVGIFPFIWGSSPAENLIGVRDIPSYRTRLSALGGCFVQHPPVGVLDSANCDVMAGWAFDPDAPGAPLVVQIYDGPAANGKVLSSFNASDARPDINAAFSITGNHGFNAPTPIALKDGMPHDVYVYGINPGAGGNTLLTQSPRVGLTCDVQHAPPVAASQYVVAEFNSPTGIALKGSDPANLPLTYTVVRNPGHGSLAGNGNSLTYTPTAGYTGYDSFDFRVNNGYLDSPSATVSIVVNSPSAPTAVSQAISTALNTPVAFTLTGSDPANLPLTYSVLSNPAHGSLAGTGPSGTYTPAPGYAGPDSFTFKVNNGFLDSAPATVAITVHLPSAPVADSQFITTALNTATAITLTGNDPGHRPLTYILVSNPIHGSLTGTGPNRTYTPTPDYAGPDHFSFKVNNGLVDSNVATVSITVNLPSAPTAANQSINAAFNTPAAITLVASDPSHLPLVYSVVGNPTHGTLSGTGNTRTYTPAAGYSGPDHFTFKANNGFVDSNVATVSLTVQMAGTPIATGQSITTPVNTSKSITLFGSDPNNLPLAYTVVTFPAHGTVSGTDKNRTYVPAVHYEGPDSFTFKVNNGIMDSAVATVSITVTAGTPGMPLPAPDLSGIHGKTFTLRDTIVLTYPNDVTTFGWELIPEAAMGLGARTAGAPVVTGTPRFNLSTLTLAPGRYTLRVQAVQGAQQSSWASASITLVNDALTGFRVFPNPWRSDRHSGSDLVFDHLPAGATVKLFTLSGRWIKSLDAPAGLAAWNLRTDSGDSAASGLYLYLIDDHHGNQARGKITVIK